MKAFELDCFVYLGSGSATLTNLISFATGVHQVADLYQTEEHFATVKVISFISPDAFY